MEKLLVSKVYVLHVKNGYDERLISIKNQFSKLNIDFELITDGDMVNISQTRLDKYFSGSMHSINPIASCALKHFLVYEDMRKNEISESIIFEDDIILTTSFNNVFNQTIDEAKRRTDIDENLLFISYENSTLKSVGKSKRIPSQYLYQSHTTRCAGAYFITKKVALKFLDSLDIDRCDCPIDWFHKKILKQHNIPIYWCFPSVAEQGSHNGLFRSSLEQKKCGRFRQLTWNFLKMYKSFIYKLK